MRRMPDSQMFPKTHAVRLAALLVGLLAACRTTPPTETPSEPPEQPPAFQPAGFVATIQAKDGAYPTLFAPTSYAVWVEPEVAELKKQKEADAGSAPDALLERDASRIQRDFLVFECHVESVFGDMSIGYDAVRFRGVEVYLLIPGLGKVNPLQILIDPSVEEEQEGALKRFRRTNIIIFPRKDLLLGKPTIPPNSPSVELVLEAQNSTFCFEWPSAMPPRTPAWKPVAEEAARLVKIGFTELYTRLRRLAHMFD